MTVQAMTERPIPIVWYLAAMPALAQKKALAALKEHRFTVYAPMQTRWKAVPKGPRERVEHPMFPGYIFIGVATWNRFDLLHDVPGIRVIPTAWNAISFAAMVADFAFRQCAGEFDKTEGHHYVPPKPMTGPLATTIGKDMSCLDKLMKRDANGRLDLLFSGELLDGEPVEAQDVAA